MGLWAVLVYAQPTRAAECPGHVVSTSTGPNPALGTGHPEANARDDIRSWPCDTVFVICDHVSESSEFKFHSLSHIYLK